jgi:hypothetical protein
VAPVWVTHAGLYFSLCFLFFPIAMAIGSAFAWAFFGVALLGGIGVALVARRWYRMTVLERGDGFWLLRLESARAFSPAARATSRASVEPE